jgi:hypothetical protein
MGNMDDSDPTSSLLTWLGGSALAGVLAIILVVAIVLTPLAALHGLGNTLRRSRRPIHGATSRSRAWRSRRSAPIVLGRTKSGSRWGPSGTARAT